MLPDSRQQADAIAHYDVESSDRASVRWWRGWSPLVLTPAAVVLFAPSDWPRWVVMWSLAFAIYCGCKWLTWRRTPLARVPTWKHAAYLLAWPGLDAAAFLREQTGHPPHRAEWTRGARNLVVGLIMFFGIARLVVRWDVYTAGWIGMAGVALFLHFGLFQLLSGSWRRAGIQAPPLMNKPLMSKSLAEFWGRRWNTAFRDLTHRFLFRPLTRRLGVRAGLAGGFVFSGLVHDLVISWPAGGGYGGPTLFFSIQALGMLIERSRFGHEVGLARGIRGWFFTMLALLLPAPLLFHPRFVEGIVVPFMHSLKAL
jgi:alginate O-acetyltransferase complex protein AlgI